MTLVDLETRVPRAAEQWRQLAGDPNADFAIFHGGSYATARVGGRIWHWWPNVAKWQDEETSG